MRRLIVGISGSSGAIYGVRLVEVLSGVPEFETHLIVSRGAEATIAYETAYDPDRVFAMAEHGLLQLQGRRRPRVGHFRHRRHDRGALLDEDPLLGRQQLRKYPHRQGSRCLPQGTPQAGSGDPGDAPAPRPPQVDVPGDRNRRGGPPLRYPASTPVPDRSRISSTTPSPRSSTSSASRRI